MRQLARAWPATARWQAAAIGAFVALAIARPGPAGAVEVGGSGVEVVCATARPIEAHPGQIVALAFRVRNWSEATATCREELTLPEAWRAVSPLLEFVLDPGGELTRSVTIQVGWGTPPGDHEIRYSVASRERHDLGDQAVAAVTVLRSDDLLLLLDEPMPARVAAGQTLGAKARLVNRGSVELDVRLEATLSDSGEATVTPVAVRLAGGQSQTIAVTARTGAATRPRRVELRLQAHAPRPAGGRPLVARLTLPIVVLPAAALPPPRTAATGAFPVEVFTRLGAERGQAAAQLGAQGGGYLDARRTRQAEFLVQAPEREDLGPPGEWLLLCHVGGVDLRGPCCRPPADAARREQPRAAGGHGRPVKAEGDRAACGRPVPLATRCRFALYFRPRPPRPRPPRPAPLPAAADASASAAAPASLLPALPRTPPRRPWRRALASVAAGDWSASAPLASPR